MKKILMVTLIWSAEEKELEFQSWKKESYNKNIYMRWQEKARVDRPVMVDIAKDSVKFKKEKHGDDSVLLIYDNLDAHCHEKIRDIFGAANILVWYCVPDCTDLIQPIDAGIGHSIRIYVRHDLDKWLSVDDNLEAWEDRLCAKDRRILMTNLLAGAMSNILSDEKKNVRISSFTRTRCY